MSLQMIPMRKICLHLDYISIVPDKVLTILLMLLILGIWLFGLITPSTLFSQGLLKKFSLDEIVMNVHERLKS